MDLLGDLETAVQPPEQKCKAAVVLDALSLAERALADRRNPDGSWAIPSRDLSAVLEKNGIYVGKDTLASHRSGRCSYSKPT